MVFFFVVDVATTNDACGFAAANILLCCTKTPLLFVPPSSSDKLKLKRTTKIR